MVLTEAFKTERCLKEDCNTANVTGCLSWGVLMQIQDSATVRPFGLRQMAHKLSHS